MRGWDRPAIARTCKPRLVALKSALVTSLAEPGPLEPGPGAPTILSPDSSRDPARSRTDSS